MIEPGMTISALAVLLSLALIGWLAFTAPEGYEDEEGFHFGRPLKARGGLAGDPGSADNPSDDSKTTEDVLEPVH